MPLLKGEVAFRHVSDEMTEGSAVEEPSCNFLMYRHKKLSESTVHSLIKESKELFFGKASLLCC